MKRLKFVALAILALLLSSRAAGSLSISSFNYPSQVAAWSDYYVYGQITNSNNFGSGWFNFDRQVLGTWHSIYGGGVPANGYADFYNPSGLPFRDGGNQIITYRITGGSPSGDALLETHTVEIVGPPEYALTVNFGTVGGPSQGSSGTGGSIDGYYPEGTNVTVIANTDPQNRPFANWSVVSGPGSFTNSNVTPTTFVMGAGHATIEANYKEPRTLTVQNGTGSGTYYVGDVVNISANQPPSGQIFSGWSHVSGPGSLANASSSSTTFTMGNGNSVVNATYGTAPPPPTITKQPMDLTLMVGQTFSVYVFVAGSMPFSFQWYRDGSPVPGATTSTYYVGGNGAEASHAGTYHVVVSNAYGTVTSNSAVVTVYTPENFGWGNFTPGTDPGTPSATVGVGALAASVSVDNKGSANGSIPLKIPPGRGGLQPALSLNYSSAGGNGPLGLGWSLSTGFPQAITRGRSILARDNEVRGVTFTSSDKFYLDGKRLINVSGTYGAPGSVYRTEVDSFVTVTTSGTSGNIETFVVTDKSGTKMTFGKHAGTTDGYQMGGGAGETLAYAYALKQVEDTLGNTVTFSYAEVANTQGTRFGEYVLSEIRYTGGLAAPQGRVTFHYNFKSVAGSIERRDRATSYVGGKLFAQSRRLDGINVEFASERVGYYSLDYGYGANGGPLQLTSVTPYLRNGEGTGFTSFASTQMAWSASSPNYSTQVSNGFVSTSTVSQTVQNWGAYWNTSEYYAFADVNGDGFDDLVDTRGTQVSVSLATGAGGFHAPASWTASGLWTGPSVVMRLADINGDGRKDMVFARTFSAGGKIYALVSNGSAFVPLSGSGSTPTEIYTFGNEFVDSTPNTDYLILKEDQNGVSSRFAVADFTGDGCDDILIHRYDGKLKLIRWSGAGFDTSLAPHDVGATPLINDNPWIVTHNGSNWELQWLGLRIRMKFSVQMIPCELNGDGIMDYAWVEAQHQMTVQQHTPGNNTFSASMGKQAYAITTQPGGGFSPKTGIHFSGASPSSQGFNAYRNGFGHLLVGDVNGDGLTDFLSIASGDIVNSVREMKHGLLLSRGSPGQPTFHSFAEAGISATVPVGNTTVMPYFDAVSISNWTNDGFSDIGSLGNLAGVFFSLVLSSSGDNMYLHDVNQDGRHDYLWYVDEPSNVAGWWVMYSRGTSFAAPVQVPSSQIPWSPTPKKQGGVAYRDLSIRQALQLNGDGIPDYAAANIQSTHAPGVDFFHLSNGQPGHRLNALTDGLGRRTDIAYKPITDSSIYTPGAAVSYPIREVRSAQYVVSDLWQDSGDSSQPAQFSYQYSGNRLDLSGRGSLGFHSFVTLDRQTSLFKYQFLAQSFPMTGLTHRDETYRHLGGTSFNVISSHDNTVVFDKVATSGGATLWPFISRAIETRWEDGAGALSTGGSSVSSDPENLFTKPKPGGHHIQITATSVFDNQALGSPQLTLPGVSGYSPSDLNGSSNAVKGTTTFATFSGLPGAITHGNLRELKTDFGGGYREKVETKYYDPTSNGITGLIEWVQTSVWGGDFGPENTPEKSPRKTYTYKPNTPLVLSEFVDATTAVPAGTANLNLTTTYTRDSRGRIENITISSPDPAIGSYSVSSVSTFDPNFDLPATSFNAEPYLHQTATQYHAFLGLPTSVKGPNYVAGTVLDEVTTDYDALGRATKIIDKLKGLETVSTFAADLSVSVAGPAGWNGVASGASITGVTGLTLASAYRITVTSTAKPTVTTWFDRLGRPIRSIKDGFNGQQVVTDTAYNNLGQVVAVSNPYPLGGAKYWTTTAYDELGRVKTVTAPNGTVTTNDYYGRATQVSVDAPNLGGINPTAQVNTTLVDAKGRTVKVWNADNVPSLSGAVSDLTSPTPSIAFALDGFGRMRATTLKDQTQQITATYDALGRQISLNDPDKGPWTYVNNALGQVVGQTDAVGNTTTSTFDRLGRPLTRVTSEPAAGPVETAKWFYYDSADNGPLQLVAKGTKGWVGALQREESSTAGAPGYAATNSFTTSTRYYNAKGLPELTLNQIDGTWFYSHTSYDLQSRPQHVRYYWRPANAQAANQQPYVWQDFGYSYSYDSKSYVLGLTDSLGRSWWDSPTYDHLDRVTSVRKGSAVWTQRTYRPEDGVVQSIQSGPTLGNPLVQNLAYGFDGLGNLRSRSDGAQTETFAYDNLNRLTNGTKQGAIDYFDNGNIKKKTGVAGETTADYAYHTTTKPHAVATAFGYSHSYDANGNLVSRTNGTTTWDLRYAGFDKPRWMTKTDGTATVGSEFLYNANRSRVIQLEYSAVAGGGVPSQYVRKRVYGLGPVLEANYDHVGGANPWSLKKVRLYVSGPDGTIGSREFDVTGGSAGTEKALVYHLDHLGSTQSITPWGVGNALATNASNESGRYSEDPWGARRNPFTWTGVPTSATDNGGAQGLTPRGFTGHEMLDDLGLVHMNGRIYDPLLGRFLSADVLVDGVGNLQGYNRYSYVKNNPLTFTDPSGFYGLLFGSYYGAPQQVHLKASETQRKQIELSNHKLNQNLAIGHGVIAGGALAAVAVPEIVGTAGLVKGAATGATIGGAVGGTMSYGLSGGDLKATVAGTLGGAVSGAITGGTAGVIANTVATTGLTTAVVAEGTVASVVSGGAAGAAGSVTTQTAQNLMNGDSLTTAVARVDGAKVAQTAAVGAIANTVMGGTVAAAEGAATRAISQGEVSAANHVANVATSVQAQSLPASVAASAANTLVGQASSAIAGNVVRAEAAAAGAATTAGIVSQVIENTANEIAEKKLEEDERRKH